MMSKGYLSPEKRNRIRVETLSDEKARNLIDTMMGHIRYNKHVYYNFIEILEQEGQWTEPIVSKLCDSLSHPQTEQPALSVSPSQEKKNPSGEFSMTQDEVLTILTQTHK